MGMEGFKPEESIKGVDKTYREQETVNGVEISVAWDESYNDYTIYFPQIVIDFEKGVSDQVLRITRRSEEAKKVFDYVAELARTGDDVHEIYKKVELFSKGLIYDEDEE